MIFDQWNIFGQAVHLKKKTGLLVKFYSQWRHRFTLCFFIEGLQKTKKIL